MGDINKALKHYGLGHITSSRNVEHTAASIVRNQLIDDGHYSSDELPTVPDMILFGELYKQQLDLMKK